MFYKSCLDNIKNGFLTGYVVSLIFVLYESYILTLLIGIWVGMELTPFPVNKNSISTVQADLDKPATCIQKYSRRWLVRLGNKIYYPYYLEWSISCKWQSLTCDIDLPDISNKKKDIIRLEKKYHHLIQEYQIDTQLYPNIWLVELPKHQLSRYSVLLPTKSCRKKKDNCRKCKIFKQYQDVFERYSHQNPDWIKKIKKGDLLIGYRNLTNFKYTLYGEAESNAMYPFYPSIKKKILLNNNNK